MKIKATAFLFDLNGTVIDDMHYHADAWFDILNNDLGTCLSWDDVKVQMYGKNEEVLARIFGDNYFSNERVKELSFEKERRYQHAYLPQLKLMDGLQQLLDQCQAAGIKMAIGSAAIPFNIDFVLTNLQLHKYFPVVVSADDVSISKPHPETFLQCAKLLGVQPKECIVFEDAPKGVESAYNAGMSCFVLTTTHPMEDFAAYDNIIGFAKDYTGLEIG